MDTTEKVKKSKIAAGCLHTISETLREIAWTEQGECDDYNVLQACKHLLRLAGKLDAMEIDLRNGRMTSETFADIPF